MAIFLLILQHYRHVNPGSQSWINIHEDVQGCDVYGSDGPGKVLNELWRMSEYVIKAEFCVVNKDKLCVFFIIYFWQAYFLA